MALNLKNPTELALLHVMAKSEGRLVRTDFPTKQLFYKMQSEGYIKKDTNGYKITDKFKKSYLNEVDKNAKFSATGSPKHERGVLSVLRALPPSALGNVKSAADLAASHKDMSRTSEYKNAVESIKQNLIEQRNVLDNQLKESQSKLAIIQTNAQIMELNRYIKRIDNPHRGVSPSDLMIKLSRIEVEQTIDKLREQEHFQAQVNQLSHLLTAQHEQQTFSILCEIVTSNYEPKHIMAHNAYATICQLPIIYFNV